MTPMLSIQRRQSMSRRRRSVAGDYGDRRG